MEEKIEFYTEDCEFELKEQASIREWICKIIEREGKTLHHIDYIFCSDKYLHEINVKYLEHDTYTDIITFPLSDLYIESNIFISIDRIYENSTIYGVDFDNELKRVIIHGVLHLCGYKDKTDAEEKLMREKENEAIAIYKS